MVGLVFAEELVLSGPQWLALALNAAAWLWQYRRTSLSGQCFLTALLSLSALWIAFWNTPASIDQQMLFEQARYLSRFDWPEFLEAIVSRPYVEYQPPFVTFWLSRMPIFWAQQLLFLPLALLCVALMFRLYGRPAALLCATPVFALMIHQPCSDTLLFGGLLIVLRLLQLSRSTHPPAPSLSKRGGGFCFARFYAPRRNADPNALRPFDTERRGLRERRRASSREHQRGFLPLSFQERGAGGEFPNRLLAALVYGLSWLIKPLTILTLPFLLPQLGLAGLGSLGIWGAYIAWSRRWEFGRRQFAFLLHQLALKSMKRPGRRRLRPPFPRPAFVQRWRRLLGTLRWRWEHLGQRAVAAFPFYLFPAWLRPWTWKGVLLAAAIVLGYGNSKYLLLDLLFLFPARQDSQT